MLFYPLFPSIFVTLSVYYSVLMLEGWVNDSDKCKGTAKTKKNDNLDCNNQILNMKTLNM